MKEDLTHLGTTNGMDDAMVDLVNVHINLQNYHHDYQDEEKVASNHALGAIEINIEIRRELAKTSKSKDILLLDDLIEVDAKASMELVDDYTWTITLGHVQIDVVVSMNLAVLPL